MPVKECFVGVDKRKRTTKGRGGGGTKGQKNNRDGDKIGPRQFSLYVRVLKSVY